MGSGAAKPVDAPGVVVGPVIGEVTDSTARVLVEVNFDGEVVCELALGGNPDAQAVESQVLRLPKFVPRVFKFAGLRSATRYAVRLRCAGADLSERTGSLRTLDLNAPLRVVAASCDKTSRRGSRDLFRVLHDDYVAKGLVDVMVRHGDQVYADDAFKECKAIYRSNRAEEEKRRLMYEEYAKVYRRTFDAPSVRRVMANCPQLMLWDDHEVRNDWGTFAQDRDPKSEDAYIAEHGARRAFWAYQRQLFQDLDERGPVAEEKQGQLALRGLETHVHVYGKCGILFIDTRGSRSFGFQPGDEGLFVGARQMEAVSAALAPGGLLANIEQLLCVHSMPAVYLSTGVSGCLACIKALRDKLGIGLNPAEQGRYLRLLCDWKAAQPNRDVLIVAGDLHFAMETDIQRAGEPVLRQVVTSAISNSPPPWIARCWLQNCCMSPCCSAVGEDFAFRHQALHNRRNFALLVLNDADHAIKSRLVLE